MAGSEGDRQQSLHRDSDHDFDRNFCHKFYHKRILDVLLSGRRPSSSSALAFVIVAFVVFCAAFLLFLARIQKAILGRSCGSGSKNGSWADLGQVARIQVADQGPILGWWRGSKRRIRAQARIWDRFGTGGTDPRRGARPKTAQDPIWQEQISTKLRPNP